MRSFSSGIEIPWNLIKAFTANRLLSIYGERKRRRKRRAGLIHCLKKSGGDFYDRYRQYAGTRVLVFYAYYCGAILLALVGCQLWLHIGNVPNRLSSWGDQQSDDPYFLAWLKGGENRTLQALLLACSKKKMITRTDGVYLRSSPANGTLTLSSLESAFWEQCPNGFKLRQLLSEASLKDHLAAHFEEFKRGALRIGFVVSDSAKVFKKSAIFISFALIFGLGGFKFSYAISHGHHNVGFLVLEMMLAGWLIILTHIIFQGSLTFRGRRFLRTKTAQFKKREWGSSPEIVLGFALLGPALLQTTIYEDLAKDIRCEAQYGGDASFGTDCATTSCGSVGGESSGGGAGCGGCGGGGH